MFFLLFGGGYGGPNMLNQAIKGAKTHRRGYIEYFFCMSFKLHKDRYGQSIQKIYLSKMILVRVCAPLVMHGWQSSCFLNRN